MDKKGTKLSRSQLWVLVLVLIAAYVILSACLINTALHGNFMFMAGIVPAVFLLGMCLGAVFPKQRR